MQKRIINNFLITLKEGIFLTESSSENPPEVFKARLYKYVISDVVETNTQY